MLVGSYSKISPLNTHASSWNILTSAPGFDGCCCRLDKQRQIDSISVMLWHGRVLSFGGPEGIWSNWGEEWKLEHSWWMWREKLSLMMTTKTKNAFSSCCCQTYKFILSKNSGLRSLTFNHELNFLNHLLHILFLLILFSISLLIYKK